MADNQNQKSANPQGPQNPQENKQPEKREGSSDAGNKSATGGSTSGSR